MPSTRVYHDIVYIGAVVGSLLHTAKGCDTIVNGTAEKVQVNTIEDRNDCMFKGVVDATLYLAVYFALPLYSVVTGIDRADYNLFFTALSTCFCLVYDCYSRYKGKNHPLNKKLYLIGVLYSLLGTYTFYMIQMYLEHLETQATFSIYLYLPYLLLAVAPVCGATDFFKIIREDWMCIEANQGRDNK